MAAAETNRKKLLTCALREFSSRGFDGVGVQEIVDAAAVTKPTLYHYFGSKLGLLEALVEEHFEPFEERLQRAADYRHDVTRTLTEIVRAFFAFAREDTAFYRLQMSLWFAPAKSDAFKVVSRFHQKHFAVVQEVFRKAAADHGNMKGRERAYAASFLGMVNNYAGLFLNGHSELEDTLVHQAVHHFMHGIFS